MNIFPISTKILDLRKKLPYEDNSVKACFSHMLYCMSLTSLELENLNNAPRIAQKVRGVDRDKVPKRKSLKKFRKFLDLENPNKICFLTNTPIEDINPPIDHVIPWSYMYSDDLWNLVYVKKSKNSSMNNRIKKNKIKNKLIKRNTKLLQMLDSKKISSKEVEELRLAIDKDYVQQFWIGYQG